VKRKIGQGGTHALAEKGREIPSEDRGPNYNSKGGVDVGRGLYEIELENDPGKKGITPRG